MKGKFRIISNKGVFKVQRRMMGIWFSERYAYDRGAACEFRTLSEAEEFLADCKTSLFKKMKRKKQKLKVVHEEDFYV
jgi:hypothetical protein